MRRPTSALLLAAALAFAGSAFGQAAKLAPDDLAPGQSAPGGIQGQNIFDVKPEVKPDASSLPGYDKQTNGQRNAVQPGNNAPMWRGVQRGMEGYSSLPKSEAPEAGVLIQPQVKYPGAPVTTAGEAWRQVRNRWIIPYGGALFAISLLALAIFWFTRGALGHEPAVGGGGRKIERFTPFERAAHWSNAIAFVLLAVSGLVMGFGKFLLLPLMGQALFGWLTYALKNIHNFAGPLFAVSLVIVIATFIKDNFPRRGDLGWLLKAGGVFSKSGEEPPSHRFNSGEKVVFWLGVFTLGLTVVVSGLVFDKLVPSLVYDRGTMQVTHMVHATAAILMMCITALHIYLGTVGVKGAYDAMRHGYVDEAWAKEHHAYWYDDIKAGKLPEQRSKPLVVTADAPESVRTA